MIPARRVKLFSNWFAMYMRFRMRRAFNRLVVMPFTPKPGHSVLLLCNHFSWWDGLWGNYLAYWHLDRKLYIMMQEDHLKKRMLLNLFGGFSINRSSREMIKSLQYAAGLLNDPENLVVVFPQGELISNHTTEIRVEKGIERLIKNIKGPCQIVYNCALIDYFESLKPSVFFHLFDCGVANEVPFDELITRINTFHQQALKAQIDVEH
ncbi:lysophospholipid acyltransferase family protein [Mucilaginibacter sp. RB4R14]|uniref:lysophospholipid acyltransferase family protein n=1 Tax=Mucilaginibacter aurantiaciroseus TaxID=2949308 RepID=UPI002090BFB5|nr:lysophospholipid acyltransferase family protein [Mucilaginibacter aurantiaciroseus]MCO5937069.1 lysophospholipid acyltransferase family protein [Mucilaginibacter aurantiaciroseus]